MHEKVKPILESSRQQMEKTIEHLDREMSKVRAGKANPKMLDGVLVDFYGNKSPLSQVAGINTPDSRTITISPWDKKMIPVIEKAIMAANLGLNPDNNGDVVRVNVPPLTEDRRKDLVKMIKKMGEDSRVGLRNIRREAIEHFKKLKKDGLPEDVEKDAEQAVQKLTDEFMKKIDVLLEKKEKDIMTV